MDKLSVFDEIFTQYQNSLGKIFLFELKSFLGRLFYNKKAPLGNNKNLLHIGAGTTKLDGWVNADFFRGFVPFRKYHNLPDWMIDLRFPLKCDDNVWDGVFSEHTLEHLYPNQAFALLKELHRTMKPGAWFRISVPNLEKYVDYYSGKPGDGLFKQWESGCEAICFLTQSSIHYSVWDSKFLGYFLEKAGFVNVREVEFMQGTDPEIIKELASRKWESLYMEAQKPS